MKCTNCNHEVLDKDNFCELCGKKLNHEYTKGNIKANIIAKKKNNFPFINKIIKKTTKSKILFKLFKFLGLLALIFVAVLIFGVFGLEGLIVLVAIIAAAIFSFRN
jgi:uncharacterized membrane protein YvbJ